VDEHLSRASPDYVFMPHVRQSYEASARACVRACSEVRSGVMSADAAADFEERVGPKTETPPVFS
jgi:hypothetical protein